MALDARSRSECITLAAFRIANRGVVRARVVIDEHPSIRVGVFIIEPEVVLIIFN